MHPIKCLATQCVECPKKEAGSGVNGLDEVEPLLMMAYL